MVGIFSYEMDIENVQFADAFSIHFYSLRFTIILISTNPI